MNERQAVTQPPTFQDVVVGLRHATERVTLIAIQLEETFGAFTGSFPTPSKDSPLTQPSPAGVIPEFSVLLQEVHLQLGRAEKARSLIRSL